MTEVRILSIIPPMTQLNTPYPSTAYLTGFLRSREFKAEQADLSIALALKLLSVQGVQAIHRQVGALPRKRHTVATRFFAENFESYRTTISPAIRFLQGRDPSLAHRIASRHYLPEGPRFASLEHYIGNRQQEGDALDWAFGALGLQDRAKHIATLYLNDLADVIRDAIDPRFEFVRYAESLAASQPTFDQLQTALSAPHNLVDASLHELTLGTLSQYQPTLVLITAPFPGNVYGAFRVAQTIKQTHPSIVTVLGGGYCNTELRALNEPRVFDYSTPANVRCSHSSNTCRTSDRWISWCARIRARINTSTSKSPISLSPKAARRPTRVCRCRTICHCSTCSTPCTVSGRTAAGTS
jgi:hypothetical protein